MIKPGTLVFFRNGLGEVFQNHVGIVAREKRGGPKNNIYKYYVHWTGDWINGWCSCTNLVEVIKK